jgi:hypothetical protein
MVCKPDTNDEMQFKYKSKKVYIKGNRKLPQNSRNFKKAREFCFLDNTQINKTLAVSSRNPLLLSR